MKVIIEYFDENNEFKKKEIFGENGLINLDGDVLTFCDDPNNLVFLLIDLVNCLYDNFIDHKVYDFSQYTSKLNNLLMITRSNYSLNDKENTIEVDYEELLKQMIDDILKKGNDDKK